MKPLPTAAPPELPPYRGPSALNEIFWLVLRPLLLIALCLLMCWLGGLRFDVQPQAAGEGVRTMQECKIIAAWSEDIEYDETRVNDLLAQGYRIEHVIQPLLIQDGEARAARLILVREKPPSGKPPPTPSPS